MLMAIEATIEKDGEVSLMEPVHLTHACRAIVTIMTDTEVPDTALLSEAVLAKDWERPEEDEAWSLLR